MAAGPAWAQAGDLRLSLSKDWGFALGGQVQGLFSLSVSGAGDLASVRYELDGNEIATVTQPPFKLQFNTDKYSPGGHKLSATARTSHGETLHSNAIAVEFVTAQAGWQAAQRIIIPLLAVVGLATVLGIVAPLVFSGKRDRRLGPGAPRHYGVKGGAICPKCGRPFALSFLSLNLVTHYFDRCPYCDKWSVVRPASRDVLAAAEAAELAASKPNVPQVSPEEKLRQQIEESRYQ